MESNYIGTCCCCGGDIYHEKKHDYGAYTKKWSEKEKRYTYSDFWHSECYKLKMDSLIGKGTPEPEFGQLLLFK